jgi:threonine dehydratase
VVLVDDDAIRGAQRTLWQAARIAAEPAAAVGIVALLTGAYKAAQREAAPAWNATKSRRQAETPPGSTASR